MTRKELLDTSPSNLKIVEPLNSLLLPFNFLYNCETVYCTCKYSLSPSCHTRIPVRSWKNKCKARGFVHPQEAFWRRRIISLPPILQEAYICNMHPSDCLSAFPAHHHRARVHTIKKPGRPNHAVIFIVFFLSTGMIFLSVSIVDAILAIPFRVLPHSATFLYFAFYLSIAWRGPWSTLVFYLSIF
jgi:hypothetical protein